VAAVKEWPRYAREAGVLPRQREHIARTLRLEFGTRGRKA
jgi:hypothetical protein